MTKSKLAEEASSWSELEQLASLEDVCKAIRHFRVQREAHQRYNARKQAILRKAIELGLDKEI